MNRDLESMKLVFHSDAVNGLDVFSMIRKNFISLSRPDEIVYRGKKTSVKQFEKIAVSRKVWGGGLVYNNFEFQYAGVFGRDLRILEITALEKISKADWDFWANSFLGNSGFIQGWIFEQHYDYWQNAESTLVYTVEKRDYSGLPMVSNGLSYPNEKMIIDVSKNPGRWIFCDDYVEAIGSTMWLSDLFWDRVGKDKKENLLSDSSISSSVMACNVLKVVANDAVFVDESTSLIQDHLRAVLYGN